MAQTITLNFKIIGQSLERLDDNRIVEKAKNYVNAHFEFNELWDDTTKAILIEGSGLRYKVYLNENNECSIPNRVVRHDGFTLTVVGEDSDKNITITTNDLFISISSNNVTDDTPSYVEVIESNTLDVTREGEKYNIEIPESYKNCYIVTSNDVTNITPITGGTYSVTLSEEMASVITTFKQNLYVDWENEFPDVVSTLEGIKITNCYPSKKINFGEELPTYYVFSATDGTSDFSMSFFYEDDTWKISFTHGNLVTLEDLNIALEPLESQIADKSKVVPNPTLSGDEPDLEGAEIDGIKYKVGGGGGKLYKHDIFIRDNSSGHYIQSLGLTIYTTSNTPITIATLPNYFPPNYNRGYSCTGYSARQSDGSSVAYYNYYISFHNESGTLYARPIFSSSGAIDILSNLAQITDTVTEV